jgi:Uma2 family endonuclease
MGMSTSYPEAPARQRRITSDEYHRMIEAGILGEDEHVQLIDGFLVAMTPQGSLHALVIQRLTAALVRAVGNDLAVRPQLPLSLPDDSEPEPDAAVVRAEDQSRDHHPRRALLVVEVAADSLRLDRGRKSALYARAGIPEYWIVNLEDTSVEVRRQPDAEAGVYLASFVVAPGQALVAAAVPGVSIDVAALFR